MGRITVNAFIVTTDAVTAYGGVQFPEEELQRIADQIRRGGLPMIGNHDERLQLQPRLQNVDVRPTRSGALGVWVEFEIDEEAWKAAEKAMGGIGGFSVSVVEAYMEAQGDPSKPFVQIASDAAHFDDSLRDEVAEALRPNFDVKSSRLYQFAESPPAKVIIEFGVPLLILIQSVGINVFSSALWDGLKLFLQEKRAKVAKFTYFVFTMRRADGTHVRCFMRTADEKVLKHALDKMREIANSSGSTFEYDEEHGRWTEED
jgi:hypothetical protein